MSALARVMPAQRPHRSVQEVGTPRDFLDAVRWRFGLIGCDLAASRDNAVTPAYFGPDHHGTGCRDALSVDWSIEARLRRGWFWLNPPYARIGPWARKCAEESAKGARVLLLVPASVGSSWFVEWVAPHAYVLELSPRLKFVGHRASYPKDLILAVYSPERLVGRAHWRWK